ncbi:Fc.00g041190.m01.CDS01 [Cosmosporella sp. VM-42]
MNIPQQARRFIHGKDNLLKTTPDTWAFLQETGIEYDNSKASTLYLGREDAARISNDFTTRVMFTSRHIMHPHDLEYLDPREHPLTETMKAKYRKMIKDEPLWVIMTSANAQPGLIKSIGHRRLKAAFWTAMNELGYERFPEPGAPCISGTLLVTIRDTAKAANSPAQIFGKAVAEALHRERIKQEQPRTRTENRDTRSPR